MKAEQKRSVTYDKKYEKKKSFFKYNNLQKLDFDSPSIKNKSEAQYAAFIEGYTTPQSFNELRPISDVFSQKQLSKVSLFESVKKSKGEFYFKNIYQRSKYVEVNAFQDVSMWLSERKYFVYIISGQFNLYKQTDYTLINNSEDVQKVLRQSSKQANNSNNYNKCYIRSYLAHQHFGYQEYPLYWKEKLIFQAATNTQILLFPLDTFYKIFSNIINLSAIQLTAEFLKKLPTFREVEMEKLLRLSTFSQRIRTYPNTIIVQKGQKIDNIVLLYDGRISVSNTTQQYSEERSGFLIGKKQADSKSSVYQQEVKSLIQCDLIVIPLTQFSKVSQIKQKLKDSYLQENERNIKSRKKMYSNLSLYQIEKKQPIKSNSTLDKHHQYKNSSVVTLQPSKPKSFFVQSSPKIQKNLPNRPRTASQGLVAKRTGSKSVMYNENGRHMFMNKVGTSPNEKRSISTILGSSQGEMSRQKQKMYSAQNQGMQKITIGQLCWAKFMNRKNQLQNKEISKILNSRLPESILNESKEFAVMRPLVQKKSTYIKNFKRKIKNSHKINSLNVPQEFSQRKRMELRVESQNNRICLESFMIDDDDI